MAPGFRPRGRRRGSASAASDPSAPTDSRTPLDAMDPADGAEPDAAEPTATEATEPEATEPEATEERPPKTWSGTRLIALLAAVAVIALVIGAVAMRFIVSPAELAARTEPPEPGVITSPVEERRIENTIITRGEITYDDAVEVSVEASGGEDRPVITGHVPKVGAVLKAGDVALEVAGRPMVVLAGELPAYRSLNFGLRGPDVQQLKKALNALGFTAGDPANDTYDADTAAAVGALYERIGYPAPDGGPEAAQALKEAQRGVRDAEVSLAQAQQALNAAYADKSPDTSAEQVAVNAANDALADAREFADTAYIEVLPSLPANEALFLEALPRRVDEIGVERGDVLSGSPMSVSGAKLTIIGTISSQDAELLDEGMQATFPGPDGEDLTAEVKKISAPKSGGGSGSGDGSGEGDEGSGDGSGDGSGSRSGGKRFEVQLSPGKLTSEQIEALRGTNVRLRIPVESTEGDVLAVPIAALSAGSDGGNRVELLIGGTGDGGEPETEIVPVEVGLAADGFVEISSDDPRIEPGAKVVVGR